jgi:hypothetical protein
MALILSHTLSSLGNSGCNALSLLIWWMLWITRAKRLKNLVCVT